MKPYKHLTREERYSIEQMRKAGYKQNQIAKLLERSEGTISRELSRNTGQRGYRHKQAHKLADQRRFESRKRNDFTVEVQEAVEYYLREDYSPDNFQQSIRHLFHDLKDDWNNVPFEVANDGDVTAMAGAMAIDDSAVLGVSMGTSLAGGYINPAGSVTGWINELAFVPVDYREGVATDEWSGDDGCGVQYFSQQAVGRLLPLSGIEVSEGLGLPEQLEVVQQKMLQGDERALAIYRTIGCYFGYTIAHFAQFYEFRHLLLLGRVSSEQGGEIIMQEARRVLDLEFPELSKTIAFQTPDEKTKRHGQAIAAATLPVLD